MKQLKADSRFSPAHQNMMQAVVSFALNSANLAVTQSVAAFFALINLIKANLAEIATLQGNINDPVTGVADQKAVYKNSLVQTSALVMQAVYAYSVKTGDIELAAKMKTTPSALRKLRDNTLIGTVQAAIANVVPILDNLTAYNITEEVTDLWAETLGKFNEIVSSPKVSHDEVDVNRNAVQDLLRANMMLLYNEGDTTGMQFKEKNIDYYRGYKKARKLQPLTRHTKLRILTTTEQGMPVSHVRVMQDETSNFVITDINGRKDLYIQIPKESSMPGVYSFTVTHDTMSFNTGNITIKKGQTVTRNLVVGDKGFVLPEHQPEVKEFVEK
ncbi:MAG TPA: hypothetical protein PKN75_10855 [Bacteroidia bacterium]|nr:hypothetical protein [Bacteroidia bacterium]HNU34078.1 hypothetical protein [Bacteroidia bacterium]